MPGYGELPSEKSSHKNIPNDQTSDDALNSWLIIDSSASHLNGKSPCDGQQNRTNTKFIHERKEMKKKERKNMKNIFFSHIRSV